MSLGYAEKLSYRDDYGGTLGSKELLDPEEALQPKLELLAQWISEAKQGGIVVFTGAGISTSCKIPDFRGPNGVWTLQKKGLPLPKLDVSFAAAVPSLTHQVISGLVASGKVGYVVSQNVDNLHHRSGVPPDRLAELHGNCFLERCPDCGTSYYRDFELETVGLKETGRLCTREGCRGRLRDHVLDWEDALPEAVLRGAERACSRAELVLCLGTSLQIRPACNLPQRCLKDGGRMVLVNLQRTPKDKRATLLVHARVDDVLSRVMQRLQLPVPPYTRQDAVDVVTRQLSAGDGGYEVEVTVQSTHGRACPLPLVASVAFTFPDDGAEDKPSAGPPFTARHVFSAPADHECRVVLLLTDAADAARRRQELTQSVPVCSREDFERGPVLGRGVKRRRAPVDPQTRSTTHAFATQHRTYPVPGTEAVAKSE